MAPAATASAASITSRRFQRSTSTPAAGPSSTAGSMAARVAVVSTVADLVVEVSHHTSAN